MIFVISKDGELLMPTKRYRKVRQWLSKGQAKVISSAPFLETATFDPHRCGNSAPRLKNDEFSCHKAYKTTKIFITLLFVTIEIFASPLYKGPDIAYTEMSELGIKKGYVFEGLQASHAKTFWFPVPQSINARKGQLNIHYQSSATLSDKSLIRVDINALPRHSEKIITGRYGSWINIPLTASDLSEKYLSVTIKASLLVSDNRCLDERLTANYLSILPDTSLALSLATRTTSLQSGWEYLPKRVTLSLPQKLTEFQYENALRLVLNLTQAQKKVIFSRYPSWGNIFINSKQKIKQLIDKRYHSTEDLLKKYGPSIDYFKKEQNIQHILLPGRSIIAITEPFDNFASDITSSKWLPITQSPGYQIYRVDPKGVASNQSSRLLLAQLSAKMGQPHFVSHSTEWNLLLTPDLLPPHSQLEKLYLSVTSAPGQEDYPPLFYVYLNDVLQQAIQLSNDGKAKKFNVLLSTYDQQPSRNYLRFVVQRIAIQGDCQGPKTSYPVQINAESTLQVSHKIREPVQFVDMPSYFSSGAKIYLPEKTLNNAANSLHFLSNLLHTNHYNFNRKEISFYKQKEKLNIEQPSIIVGHADFVTKASVHFDKGRIQVLDASENTLLDLSERKNISVIQVIESNGHHGLWIMPPYNGVLNVEAPLQLINDNIAFVDNDGVIMTVNTTQSKISTIDYPEHRSWFDLLQKYRFWLMAIGWLLLTILVVHVYQKALEHKRHFSQDSPS